MVEIVFIAVHTHTGVGAKSILEMWSVHSSKLGKRSLPLATIPVTITCILSNTGEGIEEEPSPHLTFV
jgi:hypothetical protein